jgi:hypothetical protein
MLMAFLALGMLCGQISAQSCKELFRKAENLRKGEKYDAAIATYRQVQNCSDKTYGKDCDYAIKWINENRPVRKAAQPTFFGLSTKAITLPYQGGEWAVFVYGGSSWKYSVEGDWCKVRKNGNQLIVSSIAENESTQPRKARIRVQSGNKSEVVDIVNEGAPERLRSSVSNLTFPSKGESTQVEIYANTDWKVVETPEWVKTEKETTKLRFACEANPQSRERMSVVKIESPSNTTIVIQVLQGAGDEKLAFSKNELLFGPNGGDEYVKVYTDAAGWKFGDFPHWIQVTRVADDMVKIHCAPNDPINEMREGSVNVTTGLQTLGINISQEAKPVSYLIPMPNIGGRKLSFGLSAGVVMPSISTASDGTFNGSAVNYALANSQENASYRTNTGFSINAFADIHLWRNLYLQAGLGISHYTYKNEFEADGVERSFPQTAYVYLKGRTQNHYNEDYSLTMFEVPVLASYRFPITKRSHVQLNLGPVVSYGMNAKLKLKGNTDSETLKTYKVATDEVFKNDYSSVHYEGSGEFDLFGKSVDYLEKHEELGGIDVNRSQTLDDSPLSRLNAGLRAGAAFEIHGIGFGVEYTYMLTNMANKKFWDGDRWKIFSQQAPATMMGYKERHHYLGVKVSYTFRY